ncbi:transposable element Tcb2 transposase [Trichonephila clavipes]|nr:transposable element Tcb2 transposase [Trichonephila clavipes]
MPDKRARRHFSQLSEFERSLIIGKKTAGWSTRRVAGQVDRSEKTTRREDRAVSTCGLHSDSFNDTSRRADAIVPQTIPRHLAEANLKSKCTFRAFPLTPEHRQLRPASTVVPSQINVECHRLAKGPFLNGLPGTIFQQDNARPHTARVAQDFLRHFQTLPWPARSPDLSPVEHVGDQLKRQMLSCHSGHYLELDVEDLWAHLPQDNIMCLINSMPDRVVACIAAGGGSTRY